MKNREDFHFEGIVIHFKDILVSNNDEDIKILSVLMVESFFRDKFRMFLEILYWVLTSRNGKRTEVETISIGFAQVQIKYWLEYNYFQSTSPSVVNLKRVYDYYTNFKLCKEYLRQRVDISKATSYEIQKVYRGVNDKYYDKLFLKYHHKLALLAKEIEKVNCE